MLNEDVLHRTDLCTSRAKCLRRTDFPHLRTAEVLNYTPLHYHPYGVESVRYDTMQHMP